MSDPRMEGQSYEERCAILEARLAESERHREKNRKTALQYEERLREAERLLRAAQHTALSDRIDAFLNHTDTETKT